MYKQMYRAKILTASGDRNAIVTAPFFTYAGLMDYVDMSSEFFGSKPVCTVITRRTHRVEKFAWSKVNKWGERVIEVMYITKSHFADVR